MHKKLLKRIGHHLNAAKHSNPKKYRATEIKLAEIDKSFHSRKHRGF